MEDFTNTFHVNTSAMFFTAVAFLKLLDAGNTSKKSPTHGTNIKSQFLATSSIGAFNRRPLAGFSYAGSKAAVVQIIKQISTFLVPYSIRANVICPGMYPSEMLTVSDSCHLYDQSAVYGILIAWNSLFLGARRIWARKELSQYRLSLRLEQGRSRIWLVRSSICVVELGRTAMEMWLSQVR